MEVCQIFCNSVLFFSKVLFLSGLICFERLGVWSPCTGQNHFLFHKRLFFSPGITDSLSSCESYYMSGNSDADTSSDSGSLDALSSYHYDVSYILIDCFLWLKEEGPQCIQQGFFSTQMEQEISHFWVFKTLSCNLRPMQSLSVWEMNQELLAWQRNVTSTQSLWTRGLEQLENCLCITYSGTAQYFIERERTPVTERLTFVMIVRWEEFKEKNAFL